MLVSFVVDQLRFGIKWGERNENIVEVTGYSRGLHVQGSRETKEEEETEE